MLSTLTKVWRRAIGALGFGALVAVAAAHPACLPNPDIDGSKVAPIGSDADVPACEPLCHRIKALCGYAPVGCVARCEAEMAAEQRVCVGQAPSCRGALQDCVPPEAEGDAGDDAAEDAPVDEDAATEDASADAGVEDAADAAADVISDAPNDGG